MKLQWPWQKVLPERGTLTILSNGKVVVGLPKDATQEMASGVIDLTKRWLDGDASTVVFPWPIDVIDQRRDRISLAPYGYVDLARAAEQIAKAVASIDRKTVKRRPRIVVCSHPELHPELPA